MGNKAHLPRVLVLAEYGWVGGTRTYAKQLVAFYAQNKYDLTVVAQGPMEDEDMALYCQSHGVRLLRHADVVVGNSEFKSQPWHLARERRTLNAFITGHKFNIIVASVGTPGLFLGHMGFGRCSIYILHTYPKLVQPKWRRLLRRFIWAASIPNDIYFLTVSQFSKTRMLDAWGLWHRKHDVSVIYNSAGEVVVAPVPVVNDEYIHVLTVGHVVEYKNPMFWIDAAALVLDKMPNIKFLWIGPGPLIETCRQRVASLELQEKIMFVGASMDVHKYYQICDIYVQPSRIESLGLSVLDAMKYSKPCVVTNAGGLPELVRNGESGWIVNMDDHHELAERIIQLAESPTEREQMGKSGQTIYASRFNYKRWETEMQLLHKSVVCITENPGIQQH